MIEQLMRWLAGEIVYAKAGAALSTRTLLNGIPVSYVIEVNVLEGWLVRYVTDSDQRVVCADNEVRTERLENLQNLKIERIS
jgi:hypothetical protein